jgi:hypothetical protein
MRTRNISLSFEKNPFTNAIEVILTLFKRGYIEADAALGLVHEDHVVAIETALRTHVYYIRNSQYDAIKTDIALLKGRVYIEFKNVFHNII